MLLAVPVTLTASVSATALSSQISGSVKFLDTASNLVLATIPLALGATNATLALSAATVSTIAGHPIQAVYSGDTNFAPSTSGSTAIPLLINAAGGASAAFSANELVSLFGYQLADITAQVGAPLPTTLSGISVRVTDAVGVARLALLSYASPSQINLVLPAGLATGAANMTLLRGSASVFTLPIAIAAVAPGIFSANASGRGPAAAQIIRLHADGSQTVEDASPEISLGADAVHLVLHGTGVRNRSGVANVACLINGSGLPATYAGPQPEFPGLDQVDVLLPSSLAGTGVVNVAATVDGSTSNTVTLKFR